MNYDDISFKDRQLQNNINLALKEYDSITQKISGSKGGLNKYLNNGYQYQTPSRYNFTRISPFISSKKREYPNQHSFRGNYNGGQMHISYLNNNGTNDLIEEFKETLEKSQIIKDDLLKMKINNGLTRKYKNKKYNYLNKNKINSSYKYLPVNKDEENAFEEEKSSTSNGGTTMEYISKRDNIFKENNKININKKKGNKSSKKNDFEKSKLESTEKDLINKYQAIKKENRILELEIKNYKNLANQYLNFGQNYKNNFTNKYSQKIINELEQTLQQNIQNNCNIIDTILKIQKNNQSLSSKIEILSDKMNINLKKIEQRNRKYAEIQHTNEENEHQLTDLEDKKNALLLELESQKISMLKLKYQENNLNLLNESNKKVLNDKEEHILKLKNTINLYQKLNNNKKQDKLSIDFNNNIKVFDTQINNLKLELNKLLSERKKIIISNSTLQSQLFNSKSNNVENNKELQLNNQLNYLQMENKQKMDSLKEKENQLEMLKNEIDLLTTSIKNDSQLDKNKKMKINNLINVIESPNNNNNYEEQNINDQIQKASDLNVQKYNEIETICKEYLNKENEKNELIKLLESQINQKGSNQLNQIIQRQPQIMGINSINELTLNDEIEKLDNINYNNNQELLNMNPNINDINYMNNYDGIPLIENDENMLNTKNAQNNLEGNYDINNEEYLDMNQNNFANNVGNFMNENNQYTEKELINNLNEEEQEQVQEQYGNEMTDIKELKEDDENYIQDQVYDKNNIDINELEYINEESEDIENINNNDINDNLNNNILQTKGSQEEVINPDKDN